MSVDVPESGSPADDLERVLDRVHAELTQVRKERRFWQVLSLGLALAIVVEVLVLAVVYLLIWRL
jgi:hypothetical protein